MFFVDVKYHVLLSIALLSLTSLMVSVDVKHHVYLQTLHYVYADRFCIALFSALEQTHRALVVCDSK